MRQMLLNFGFHAATTQIQMHCELQRLHGFKQKKFFLKKLLLNFQYL